MYIYFLIHMFHQAKLSILQETSYCCIIIVDVNVSELETIHEYEIANAITNAWNEVHDHKVIKGPPNNILINLILLIAYNIVGKDLFS